MKSVAVATSLHDTSGLLIDNLDFIVVDYVFHILFKECVCLEELVDGVHTLGLYGVVVHEGIFLLLTKCRFERLVALDL